MAAPLRLGAVAYDPKVVTIWEGFRRRLVKLGFSPGEAAEPAELHTRNFM